MTSVPILSIIVPVYKVEAYLPRCIDSILAQTFRDFELILVDDGSPDNCPALCDVYAQKDERITVIHQKNGGLSAARNAGLDLAKGEYIGFVDSDDYIAPEMYETLLRRVREDDAQLAICSYAYVDEAGNDLGRKSPITQAAVFDRVQAMDCLGGDRSWYYITAWNRIYKRELFESIRFPVGKLHEDEFIAHRLFWACERICMVPQVLYYYVQREGSIMRQKSIRQYMDDIEGVLGRMEFALAHGLNRLAFRSCNGVLGILVNARYGGGLSESREDDLYEQVLAEVRPKLYELLKIPRYEEYKLKILLYLISPRLYYKTLWAKVKVRNLLQKRGKA